MATAQTIKHVAEFLAKMQKAAGSPAAAAALQLLKPILPSWGLTPDQVAGLDRRFVDAGVRKDRARKRAGS